MRDGRGLELAKSPRFFMRAVAALVRHSYWGARVVVGVHKMGQGPQEPLCKG
jgi:hypothetical protein